MLLKNLPLYGHVSMLQYLHDKNATGHSVISLSLYFLIEFIKNKKTKNKNGKIVVRGKFQYTFTDRMFSATFLGIAFPKKNRFHAKHTDRPIDPFFTCFLVHMQYLRFFFPGMWARRSKQPPKISLKYRNQKNCFPKLFFDRF